MLSCQKAPIWSLEGSLTNEGELGHVYTDKSNVFFRKDLIKLVSI